MMCLPDYRCIMDMVRPSFWFLTAKTQRSQGKPQKLLRGLLPR